MTAIGHYRLKHSEFQRIVVHIISQILSSLISIVIIPPFQLFGKALLGFGLFIIVIIANLLSHSFFKLEESLNPKNSFSPSLSFRSSTVKPLCFIGSILLLIETVPRCPFLHTLYIVAFEMRGRVRLRRKGGLALLRIPPINHEFLLVHISLICL